MLIASLQKSDSAASLGGWSERVRVVPRVPESPSKEVIGRWVRGLPYCREAADGGRSNVLSRGRNDSAIRPERGPILGESVLLPVLSVARKCCGLYFGRSQRVRRGIRRGLWN